MFYVIRCTKCGSIQARECRKVLVKCKFKCISCNVSITAKKKNLFGLAVKVLFQSASAKEASDKCQEIRKKEYEKRISRT